MAYAITFKVKTGVAKMSRLLWFVPEKPDIFFPTYWFCVPHQKPTYNSKKGKEKFKEAVRRKARRVIKKPIDSSDIEVEIVYGTREPLEAVDVDAVGKPTLDALEGIAYHNDRQVRHIDILKIDKTKSGKFSGLSAAVDAVIKSRWRHVVGIAIFSPSRSMELRSQGFSTRQELKGRRKKKLDISVRTEANLYGRPKKKKKSKSPRKGRNP